jgi:Mg2+-importing ATPase
VKSWKKTSCFFILIRALLHPFNILLCIIAITSGALEEFTTMGIMLGMVTISSGIRFIQELKSQQAAHNLLNLISNKVTVVRKPTEDSKSQQEIIPAEDLVPGDWVVLEPGELVPADVEVIVSNDLYVSQAALTGEPIPVEKFPVPDLHHEHLARSHEPEPPPPKPLPPPPQPLPPPSKDKASKKKSHSKVSQSKSHVTFDVPPGDVETALERDKPQEPRKHERKQKCTAKIGRFFRNLFGLRVDLETPFREQDHTKASLDLPNLCFMGTSVVSGRATAVVQAIGGNTFFGQMAEKLAKLPPQNAFQLGVRRISWIFFLIMIVLIPPIIIIESLSADFKTALIFALTVSVGLTPEMLPMVVNTTLSKGAMHMARHKCIVKSLDAIVNLGAIDVLCTDKTGTITKSVACLTKHVNRLGLTSRVPLNLAYLNSYFQECHSSPLDAAVSAFIDAESNERGSGSLDTKEKIAREENVDGNSHIIPVSELADQYRAIAEVPFDFTRRRVSILLREKSDHNYSQPRLMICKGAVEETLSVCTKIFMDDQLKTVKSGESGVDLVNRVKPDDSEVEDLTPESIDKLKEMNEILNREGLRVIAVAYKTVSPTEHDIDVSSEANMIFAGFLAFLDPPKESIQEAIENLRRCNVEIKILTGDSPVVCKKICEEINLPVRGIVQSSDLKDKTDKEISDLAREGTIFAKLTPLQKTDIVRALKRNGNIVGFLGDGINDAPALAEADVGISVDSGTDMAKDSADIILLEKNIGVVAEGVIVGRTTYGNTLKYIVMAISSNFGNVLSVLIGSYWLEFIPMRPIHILVQNLLYDISQIAIPWDHMDEEFLKKPRRWKMSSVLRFMVMMGPWSSVFDIITFLFMYFYYGIQHKDDKNVPLFQTTWFVVGLATQTIIVHMIRTPKIPFFQSRASFPVCFTTLTIMSIGLALPHIPIVNVALNLAELPWEIYCFVGAVLLSYCFVAQCAKMIYIRLFHEWFE